MIDISEQTEWSNAGVTLETGRRQSRQKGGCRREQRDAQRAVGPTQRHALFFLRAKIIFCIHRRY